jgi:hypothetical protein
MHTIRLIRLAPFAGCVFLALAVTRAPAGEPIAPERFDALRAVIRPQPSEETWLQIPWLTSLTEARRRAAELGKPILLWEMDGHPLGCT